jgi:hypothetical protein
MSDSLVLTGVKDVRKQTGTEMLRLNPKGGGDTFHLKRWWVEGGVSTVYVDATVFDVTTGVGTVKLALDTNMSTNVRIDHDGSFNFVFIGANEVSRAALFTSDMELIEHYVFPAISGGKIMTVTPASGAVRPAAGPSMTLTSVTLTGAAQADDGGTEVYTASQAGTATDTVFTVTSNNSNDVITSVSDTEFSVVFNNTGAHVLTLSGTSATAAVTKVNTKSVTIA